MKILNFGSLNLDNVYTVDHFVRNGETLASTSLIKFLGGKGLNQSIALSRAGCKVYHAGKIGTDGEALIERLKQEHINTDNVMIDSSTPTGHAIIQVDRSGQNCILLYGGANRTVSKDDIDRVLLDFEEGDLLLLQNEITNVEYLIMEAAKKGMIIILNPSPIDDAILTSKALHKVDWFILNDVEGNAITGKKLGEEICEVLLSRYPNAHFVVTLGKHGAIYLDKNYFEKYGVYDVPVVDTTAAGDTFTGYFICCVSEKKVIHTCLETASRAAALAITKMGAAESIPTRREVEEATIRLEAQFL